MAGQSVRRSYVRALRTRRHCHRRLRGVSDCADLLKVTFKLALLPFKLLLLPLIFIVVVVKIALLFAALAVVAAIVIPLAIVLAICAAPFLLLAH